VVNLSVYADEQDLSLNHPVTQRIERLSKAGVCVVAAAGNDASVMLTPPAVAPSAITVGGLDDRNSIERRDNTMYPSSFGATIHGSVKPEVIAPAIWLPAPMIPGTATQREASALVALDSLDNEQMMKVLPMLITSTELPLDLLKSSDPEGVRQHIENRIQKMKIISPHYQHVDGTSFAAPIVCSVIAQMLEANPLLTPDEVKNILMSTAERLPNVPAYRQGAGMVDPPAAVEAASDAEQFRVTSI
jgi:serine protease AprX